MSKSPHVHTIYKLASGERVPGVTTYLGILAKPAIIHWAWELGIQDIDYRVVKDQAGDTGTLVHYLALCIIGGSKPDLSEYSEQGIAASVTPMEKFKDWYSQHELEPILLETPLVSENYRYGGTPDFYGKVDGRLTLLDFKTSKAVYAENFYQLAAYKVLLEENGHEVEQCKILRMGKTDSDGFEERTAGNSGNQFQIFLACQKIYELAKLVKKENKSGT